VVLVDEYDKPILDNITNPETALELREILRHFYSILKAQSAHLHFVMLTGVSKFSKVSLFSGLNNLEDITLDPRFEKIYIIEFKINELTRPERALKQIKEKKYAEKYAGHETCLVGVEFSKKDRNITQLEWEKV